MITKKEFLEKYKELTVEKIEQMPEEDLKNILKDAMNVKFENKIVLIPFVGGIPQVVTYYTDELIARCPMTKIIDFYKLTIKYIPCCYLPELKSLKYYLFEYQDMPISHEHLADKIHYDIFHSIDPVKLYVKLEVGRRGGIDTIVEVGDMELR